jgi:glutamine amidotransferase
MCRHYAFRANEPTKVECTLVRAQNALLAQSPAHPDGWGISVYHDTYPEVERRATSAYEDLAFAATAARLFSRTVVAHVRKASIGGPALANTHPFVHGHWSFTHNGTIAPFNDLQPKMLHETADRFRPERLGTTDSELLFYWLLTRIEQGGIPVDRHASDMERLVELVAQSLVTLDEQCRQADPDNVTQLNIVLTDGNVLLASRWNHSLHWAFQHGLHVCEYCGVPHVEHRPEMDYRAFSVASEPISYHPWEELHNHAIVAVDHEIAPRVRKL